MEALLEFHFLRPLWLLTIIPALGLMYSLLRNSTQYSDWQSVIDPLLLAELLEHQEQKHNRRHQRLPIVALTVAVLLTILALAGPTWERLPQATQKNDSTMVIIADMTLSMHATDISPSRLIRSRYKLLELLKRRTEGQTALIAYSGDAHIVAPLTDDARTIAALVPPLSPELMPAIGSNARAAFKLANDLIINAQAGKTKIVWFTDEVRLVEINQITQAVKSHDSELLIIGIGTSSGGPVPLPSGKFLTDGSGNIVNAQLNRARLQDLAARTGGQYVDLRNDNRDIEYAATESVISSQHKEQNPGQQGSLNRQDGQDGQDEQTSTNPNYDSWQDRGGWLCLLLLPFVALSFRRGWVLSIYLCFGLSTMFQSLPAQAQMAIKSDANNPSIASESLPKPKEQAGSFGWQDLWKTDDQQAQALIQQEKYREAAQQFNNDSWRGIASFKAGDYDSAIEDFTSATQPGQEQKSVSSKQAANHYNQGHAQAHSGDLEAAIASYDQALAIDSSLADAQKAKSIVQSLLEQQREQEKEKQDQQDGEQQDGDPQEGEQQDSEQQNQDDSQQQGQSSEQPGDKESSSSSSSSEDPSESEQQDQFTTSEELGSEESQQEKQNPTADENQEQDDQTEQQKVAQQQENEKSKAAEQQSMAQNAPLTAEQALEAEKLQKLNQWLNKIPDDPGGLLKRKFLYERQIREQQGKVVDSSEDAQLW